MQYFHSHLTCCCTSCTIPSFITFYFCIFCMLENFFFPVASFSILLLKNLLENYFFGGKNLNFKFSFWRAGCMATSFICFIITCFLLHFAPFKVCLIFCLYWFMLWFSRMWKTLWKSHHLLPKLSPTCLKNHQNNKQRKTTELRKCQKIMNVCVHTIELAKANVKVNEVVCFI